MKSNFVGTAGTSSTVQSGFLARVSESLGRGLTAWRNRQAMRDLLYFDDRQLADIGITRGDIEWALSQPWSVDGSTELNRIRRNSLG